MAYWIVDLALVAFGLLGALSIGRPFLLIGLTMLLLGRWRLRPAVLWPPLLAMIAYNVTFWATAPLGCTSTQSIGPGGAVGESMTVCSSLLGMTWSGRGTFNPSLEPANLAGLVSAALVFLVTIVAVRGLTADRGQGGA